MYLDAAKEYADRNGIPLVLFKNKPGMQHLNMIANKAYDVISQLQRGFVPFHSKESMECWLVNKKDWRRDGTFLFPPDGVDEGSISLDKYFNLEIVNQRLAHRYLAK